MPLQSFPLCKLNQTKLRWQVVITEIVKRQRLTEAFFTALSWKLIAERESCRAIRLFPVMLLPAWLKLCSMMRSTTSLVQSFGLKFYVCLITSANLQTNVLYLINLLAAAQARLL